jgi:hypothetical protein
MTAPLRRCPGCAAEHVPQDGPTDPYGGASPECWALYGQIMAKEFSGAEHFAAHRWSVDAYMVQHPSRVSRAAIQSVWVHLAALHLGLERRFPASRIGPVMAQLTHRSYAWLEPPPAVGQVTALDVASATDAAEHFTLVRRWADSVWRAWQAHHAAVRQVVDSVLAKS